MKLSTQQAFLILPSRFVLMGVLLYVGLELLGSVSLQYITVLQDREQAVILTMRLFELLAFSFLIIHFRLAESLGLIRLNKASIRVFIVMAIFCICIAAVLYSVKPVWFAYVMIPPWLHGTMGLFLMVVLAPIVEELIFRGLLYRMLREQWGVVVSVVVSAVFFSLLHQGMLISPQLAGGIIFAVAYEWSRSLWVSMGLHMGANGAVYLLSVLA